MKSALYSQTARQTIVEAREYIIEKYAIFFNDIRKFREDSISINLKF